MGHERAHKKEIEKNSTILVAVDFSYLSKTALRKAIPYSRKVLKIEKNDSWLDSLCATYAECGD